MRHLPPYALHKTWFRHQEFLSDFPVLEEESVQLGRGNTIFKTSHALGCDSILAVLEVQPKFVLSLLPEPDWLNTLISLSETGELCCNGLTATKDKVIILANRNGYTTIGHDRKNLFFAIRKSRLRRTLAGLTGMHPDDIRIQDMAVTLPEEAMFSLCYQIMTVLNEATPLDARTAHPNIAPAQEANLISFFASLLVRGIIGEDHSKPDRSNSRQVVRMVEDAWQFGDAPLSVADMCLASGVSERHLRNCFVDFYGVSPSRYSKLRRLSFARHIFLDDRNPVQSVKEVSLLLGFIESGRFAAVYRSVFGENPSQTIGRMQQR